MTKWSIFTLLLALSMPMLADIVSERGEKTLYSADFTEFGDRLTENQSCRNNDSDYDDPSDSVLLLDTSIIYLLTSCFTSSNINRNLIWQVSLFAKIRAPPTVLIIS